MLFVMCRDDRNDGEMMKVKKIRSSLLKELDELESEITRFSDAQLSALKALTVFGETALISFSNEASRLTRTLGKNHPRVRKFKTGIKRNIDLVRNLEVQLEVARIEVPDVPDDGALVYGRIVDKSSRGIAGLSISAEYERGKPLRPFGKSETDISGYFSIPLSQKTVSLLSKRKHYLSVSYLGELVHREPKALKISENSMVQFSIILECVGWRTKQL